MTLIEGWWQGEHFPRSASSPGAAVGDVGVSPAAGRGVVFVSLTIN
jgi:hypothetical protein